jgi:metal-responsive CopG/Arc/MetJ family transcriptional regulator
MATSKIAITIDDKLLKQLDIMVKSKVYSNRSRAIQEAVADKLQRLERTRLAQECAKLDPTDEQNMAEEGLAMEMDEWPEY